MLVLSRRVGEVIIIGEVIAVTILSVQGNQVRIGIEAPRSISVHREEILLKIKDEQSILANILLRNETTNSYAT